MEEGKTKSFHFAVTVSSTINTLQPASIFPLEVLVLLRTSQLPQLLSYSLLSCHCYYFVLYENFSLLFNSNLFSPPAKSLVMNVVIQLAFP